MSSPTEDAPATTEDAGAATAPPAGTPDPAPAEAPVGTDAPADAPAEPAPAPANDPEIVQQRDQEESQVTHLGRALYSLVKHVSGDTSTDWLQYAKNEVNAVDPDTFTF